MSTKPFELPPGLTLEELDEYARATEQFERMNGYAYRSEVVGAIWD